MDVIIGLIGATDSDTKSGEMKMGSSQRIFPRGSIGRSSSVGCLVNLVVLLGSFTHVSAQSTFCGRTSCGYVPSNCCIDVYTNVGDCCEYPYDCCDSSGQCSVCSDYYYDDDDGYKAATIAIIVGPIVGGCCFCCLIGLFMWYYFYRKKQQSDFDKLLLSGDQRFIVVGTNTDSQPQQQPQIQHSSASPYPQYPNGQHHPQYPQYPQLPVDNEQLKLGYVSTVQAEAVRGYYPAPPGPAAVQGNASEPPMSIYTAPSVAAKPQDF
jgi:hypothetical protein